MLDPHTAVGVSAAGSASSGLLQAQEPRVVCLATAHAAKFDSTVIEATGLSATVRCWACASACLCSRVRARVLLRYGDSFTPLAL